MPKTSPKTVVIVGAGPVGLCTALALAEAGFRVRVVDSGARGAGWASGGMLGAVYETLAQHDALTDLAFDGLKLWSDLAHRIGCQTLSNTLFVARTPDEAAALSTLAHNPQARMTLTDVPVGMTGISAWRCEADLALDPRATLVRLRAACGQAGVSFDGGDVVTVKSGAVHLRDGCVCEADTIIIANGQGGDNLGTSVPELTHIRPVKGQLLALAANPNEPLTHLIRAGRLYLLPRGERIVIGATSNPHDQDAKSLDIAAHHNLHQEALTLWPALAAAPIVESWSGFRPMTDDGLPMLGPSLVAGVYLATGTYRNGWLLAPAIAARLTACLITGKTGQLQCFSPQRFPI